MGNPSGADQGSPPALTKQQALELQGKFIEAYSEESFQRGLRKAWQDAAGDLKKQQTVRQEFILPVQGPILVSFGFPSSRSGTLQAISAFNAWNDDPEVQRRNVQLAELTDPGHAAKASPVRAPPAKAPPAKVPPTKDSEVAARHEISTATAAALIPGASEPPSKPPSSEAAPAPTENGFARKAVAPLPQAAQPSPTPVANAGNEQQPSGNTLQLQRTDRAGRMVPIPEKCEAPDKIDDLGDGQLWVVIGGASAGGIVVRKDKDVKSQELMFRLQTGARIEEIGRVGDRLHYRRIVGDGPDYGWVSLFHKGYQLLVHADPKEFAKR